MKIKIKNYVLLALFCIIIVLVITLVSLYALAKVQQSSEEKYSSGYEIQTSLTEKYNLNKIHGYNIPITNDVEVLKEASQDLKKIDSFGSIDFAVNTKDIAKVQNELSNYLKKINFFDVNKIFLTNKTINSNYRIIRLSNNYVVANHLNIKELQNYYGTSIENLKKLNPHIQDYSDICGKFFIK